MKNWSQLVVGAMVAGFLTSQVIIADDTHPAGGDEAAKAEKKNSCKGKDGCKGKKAKKGKDSCKGKDGCKGKKEGEHHEEAH